MYVHGERTCSLKAVNLTMFSSSLCAQEGDFPVLGALKAFLNPGATGEQCPSKNALVMLV